jgi:para-nitrobenzyl esterase
LISFERRIVAVKQGWLIGTPGRRKDISVFRGVPFAKPPVGQLRWKPPEPPNAWGGAREAWRFAPICFQEIFPEGHLWRGEFRIDGREMSEDCLYLNVWTPAREPAEKLPVFVWLHGGGLMWGAGSSVPFDGENFARAGVVTVTLNYRLNIFGLLAHPELTKEGGGLSGNYLLLDQTAALRWIKENIAAFGGNPDNITLGGQSAGARCAGTLMAFGGAGAGLFHRAIIQSGSPVGGLSMDIPFSENERGGARLAHDMEYESVADMRKAQAGELYGRFESAVRMNGSLCYGIVLSVGGWAMPRAPAGAIGRGEQMRIPILTGSASDEGEAHFTAHRALAWLHCKTTGQDVYQYLFAKAPPGSENGAFHTSELAYLFQNLGDVERPWTERDYEVSKIISGYWLNFIHTGNPNGRGLPEWEKLTNKDSPVLFIGNETKMKKK